MLGKKKIFIHSSTNCKPDLKKKRPDAIYVVYVTRVGNISIFFN